MVLFDFIQKSGIKITEELQSDLALVFHSKKFEKGDYFLRQGTTCTDLAFLMEGLAVLQYVIDGEVYVRWAGLKNTFATSIASFFNDIPSENEIIFLEDSVVLNITKKDFDLLVDKHPAIQKFVIKILTQELQKYQLLTDLLITTKGTERYLKFRQLYPDMVQEVPQKYIASILGMKPRHLSRIRRKIASEGK